MAEASAPPLPVVVSGYTMVYGTGVTFIVCAQEDLSSQMASVKIQGSLTASAADGSAAGTSPVMVGYL